MLLSKKCLYGLRAVLDIARRHNSGVVTIAEISAAQLIPQRFLEGILNQLKGAGYLASKRGKAGGYLLAKAPNKITVGDIVRLMNGSLTLVDCLEDKQREKCPLKNDCVIRATWDQAQSALVDVLDSTTIQNLIDKEESMNFNKALCYSI